MTGKGLIVEILYIHTVGVHTLACASYGLIEAGGVIRIVLIQTLLPKSTGSSSHDTTTPDGTIKIPSCVCIW
jgi:hypothetical protein